MSGSPVRWKRELFQGQTLCTLKLRLGTELLFTALGRSIGDFFGGFKAKGGLGGFEAKEMKQDFCTQHEDIKRHAWCFKMKH